MVIKDHKFKRICLSILLILLMFIGVNCRSKIIHADSSNSSNNKSTTSQVINDSFNKIKSSNTNVVHPIMLKDNNGDAESDFNPNDGSLNFSGGLLSSNFAQDVYSNSGTDNIKSISFNDVSLPSDSSNMFSYLPNLNSIDMSGVDTSQVTNMSGMFAGDSNLQNVNVNGMDTSNVQSMSDMFGGDSYLADLDLSSFYTPYLTDTSNMFFNDYNLQYLNISNMNTENANMNQMFFNTTGLSQLTIGDNDSTFPSSSSLPRQWVLPNGNLTDLSEGGIGAGTYNAFRETTFVVQVPTYINGTAVDPTSITFTGDDAGDTYLQPDMAPEKVGYTVQPSGYIRSYPNDDVVHGSFNYIGNDTSRIVSIPIYVNGNPEDFTLYINGKVGTNVYLSDLIDNGDISPYLNGNYYNLSASGCVSVGLNNDIVNGELDFNN